MAQAAGAIHFSCPFTSGKPPTCTCRQIHAAHTLAPFPTMWRVGEYATIKGTTTKSTLITAENWLTAPNNRRSFQQVQSLFPTARICCGPGPAATSATAAQDLFELAYTGRDGRLTTIQQMLVSSYTDAFIVMKDGVIIFEHYDSGIHAGSHHLLNSVTKSFVGMLTGILTATGVIDPSEKVSFYIPEFTNTACHDTTVRNALDMTAAVQYGEDYSDPEADFWRETAVVGWRPSLAHSNSAASLFEYAQRLLATDQAEGEKFHYRTVLTNLLAMVLERASDARIQDLLEHQLWRKLGAVQDATIVVDRVGFPYLGAGMSTSARDLARFGQMSLQDGYFNDTQIVPEVWVRKTQHGSVGLRGLFAASDYASVISGGHYRNQVRGDAQGSMLFCFGIYGQVVYVNRKTGIVIVKLVTHTEPAEMEVFGEILPALNALSVAL